MELHSKEHFALLKRVHLKEGEGWVYGEPILEKNEFREEEQNGMWSIGKRGLQGAARKQHK